jgi:uncharacterized phiE125 gp8 family phage protein
MSYIILSTEGPELVTLAEAKAHLRVDSDVEDTLIEAYISAARSHCERFMGLSLVEQTIKATFLKSAMHRPQTLLRMDELPRKNIVELPLSPVVNLLTVEDGDGEPVEYTEILDAVPAVLTIDEVPDVLNVTYETGTATTTPAVKIAVLMLVHQMYQHRGDVPDMAVERVEEAYLRPLRVNLGMA